MHRGNKTFKFKDNCGTIQLKCATKTNNELRLMVNGITAIMTYRVQFLFVNTIYQNSSEKSLISNNQVS